MLSGLSSPVFVTNAHDGSYRLFIVEQGGKIKVQQPGAASTTDFLDITSRVLSGGERGLLGLAFHPFYKTNGRFFVYYTRQTDGAIQIAEYHVSAADPNVANTTEKIILTIPHPVNANHNGGSAVFGPDRFLYLGPGDGGAGNDPPNNAQNINQLLGKILRIDIDHANGAVPYSSPSDNPYFGSTPGADEIYAIGMRNPYRFSFDRGGTNQLYIADVGQSAFEEVDIGALGANYGWRIYEGNQCTGNDPMLCNPAGFTFPILVYDHSGGRCAIIGGYVYRGAMSAVPVGTYIFGDDCSGEIFMPNGSAPSVLLGTSLQISAFGEDEVGELYVVGLGGTVQRIVNSTPPACSFSVSPLKQSFTASGGTGVIAVASPSACGWGATEGVNWITIDSMTGSGYGTVQFTVSPNNGTGAMPRSTTITVAGQPVTIYQAANFNDVSPSDQFYTQIEKLYARGITAGCGQGNFCPNSNVSREQMAIFIIRAMGETISNTQRFNDVPPSRAGFGYINRMFELGITSGCSSNPGFSPPVYCPDSLVTREEMAIFIERALGVFNPPMPPSQRFTDVAPSRTGYSFIDEFAIRGITAGCTATAYCPDSPVTRVQMAIFLTRAFNL